MGVSVGVAVGIGVGVAVGVAVGVGVVPGGGGGASVGVGLGVGVGGGAGVAVGAGVDPETCCPPAAATTVIVALIEGCTWQKYGKVPTLSRVTGAVASPGLRILLIQIPSGLGVSPDALECGTGSRLVHIKVVPAWMVRVWWVEFRISTWTVPGPRAATDCDPGTGVAVAAGGVVGVAVGSMVGVGVFVAGATVGVGVSVTDAAGN